MFGSKSYGTRFTVTGVAIHTGNGHHLVFSIEVFANSFDEARQEAVRVINVGYSDSINRVVVNSIARRDVRVP